MTVRLRAEASGYAGMLPAYGLYARNVKGITVKQVRCTAPESEKRPEKYFDNCETICEKEVTL